MGTIQLIQLSPTELANLINEGIKTHVENLINHLSEQEVNGKEFLTRSETKDFFSISYVTLHSWVNDGLLKPYKMGNKTYFKRSELIESLTKEGREVA